MNCNKNKNVSFKKKLLKFIFKKILNIKKSNENKIKTTKSLNDPKNKLIHNNNEGKKI